MTALLCLAALPACNQESPGSSAAAKKVVVLARDPCALVTTAEVEAVIGEKVLRAQNGGSNCSYETQDAQASSVTLSVKWSGAGEEMDAVKGANKLLGNIGASLQGKEGAPGDVGNMLASKNPARDVGDDSMFDASQTLHVRKGDVYITVNPPIMRSRMSGGFPLLSGADRRKMAIAIAQKAVGRL
jgi:hypothetical protein